MEGEHVLKRGKHLVPEHGRCAMEFVAWLASETHSDRPRAACPVLGGFVRSINDYMPDGVRQGLRPYLGRMVGTAGDGLSVPRAHRIVSWGSAEVEPLVWSSSIALARLGHAKLMLEDEDYCGAVRAVADAMYRAGSQRPEAWDLLWPLLHELLPVVEVDLSGMPSKQSGAQTVTAPAR